MFIKSSPVIRKEQKQTQTQNRKQHQSLYVKNKVKAEVEAVGQSYLCRWVGGVPVDLCLPYLDAKVLLCDFPHSDLWGQHKILQGKLNEFADLFHFLKQFNVM